MINMYILFFTALKTHLRLTHLTFKLKTCRHTKSLILPKQTFPISQPPHMHFAHVESLRPPHTNGCADPITPRSNQMSTFVAPKQNQTESLCDVRATFIFINLNHMAACQTKIGLRGNVSALTNFCNFDCAFNMCSSSRDLFVFVRVWSF